ncbi:NupC/NupG family nucleoside CNT transporter [candidate division KSB1 bacterium]|nr:NupC/NupG family nucleoside CNT transporter [candidate division KSB1 bacterium]
MRFIGILGLFVFLLLGVIFSKHRKAIKPRTIVWGFSLQLLFAIIILGKSVLSWVGMYIFCVLIVIYIFERQLATLNHRPKQVFFTGSAFILSLIVITATVFLSTLQLGSFLFIALLGAYLLFRILNKTSVCRYFAGILLFSGLGLLIHHNVSGKVIFRLLAEKVDGFLKLADLGSIFLFGNLAKPEYYDQFGFQFAFSVLPTIIFFSAVMSIFYYLGIMQVLIKVMAKFMKWTMRTSGAETLSCSANIFVGQTEAPLLIRPFLNDMTPSELHAIMVGGFATIAGGVLAGYIRIGVDASHLIAASVMSAPAALMMAKLFYPEIQKSKTAGNVEMPKTDRADNLLDAAAKGVTDGLKLAVNVGAMLLAFIAIVGLLDKILGFFDQMVDQQLLGGAFNQIRGEYKGIFPGSMKTLLGTLFSPLAFLMGVPWKDALQVGNLLGIKVAVNEFVAYAELAKYINNEALSSRAVTISTYALCGFANFSSIGIQLGGIGALVPHRRSDLSKVVLRAMFAGALASWMTATIAGLLIE